MTTSYAVRDLSVHFEDTRAVDDVSFSIPSGTICGLLGRNGAGKSTLLSVLAAFREPTAGEIRIGGLDPYEDPLRGRRHQPDPRWAGTSSAR